MRKTGKSKDKGSGGRHVLLTPEEERRHEAVLKFDEVARILQKGDKRAAARAFDALDKDYEDVLDVAYVARQYAAWCRHEQAGPAEEMRKEELPDSIQCPECGTGLGVDTSTVSVWCTQCECYVRCM